MRGDGIVGMSLICEFSSIFVAWRSALSRLGFKQSKVYWFVGVTMIVIFFLVRILLLPTTVYLYCSQLGLSLYQGIMGLPKVCKVGTSIMYGLNLYWFSLMIIGLKKALFPRTKTKDE